MINPKTPEIDLGTVELNPMSTKLNEVVITGEKRLMEFNLDKKVVNVEKSLTTVGGTAVDVLQNIPSVTVDIDGNVSLRGNSNITLLIDGRPSGIDGSKLDQIPASSIETIELITNPSARYNPEGMSGIINIKLRKKRELGFNGTVIANAGTNDKYNSSLSLNYNKKNVNVFGSIDLRSDRRKGSGFGELDQPLSDTATVLKNGSISHRKRTSANYKFGIDYAINPLNSLMVSWYHSEGKDISIDSSWDQQYDNHQSLYKYYTTTSNESGNNSSNDYILNYKKTFEEKGREFTIDAVYSANGGPENNMEKLQYYHLPDMTPVDNSKITNPITVEDRFNANVQVNYIHPFTKDSHLETGYQGIVRSTDDDYKYSVSNQTYTGPVLDTITSNRFKYREDIHAVYAMYARTWEKFSIQGGVRAENAHSKGDNKTDATSFTKDYVSIFPSVHMTKKFAHDQEIQLSYSRRINRPDLWSLNPFVDRTNPSYIRYGNPDLKPEYVNSYEFGYSKFIKKTSITSSIFYRKVNDVIKRISFLDANNVMNNTSFNMASSESYGIELILDQEILKWWKINANFSFFRAIINSAVFTDAINTVQVPSNDNYSWTSRLNSSMSFPGKLALQINGNYRGPMVTPQGEMAANFSMDVALKKDLFGDKFSVNFRVSDIFNTQKWRNTSTGDGFSSMNERKRESRVAYLGITWKFGQANMKAKPRKRQTDQNGGPDENGGDY